MSKPIKIDTDYGEREFASILDALKERNVLCVDAEGDKFVLTEWNDGYYHVSLTAEQLRKLGEELIALSKTA